jgi:hypothetical protein
MSGFHDAIYITLGISVLLTMLGTILFVAGAPGLQRPDLRRWLKDDKPAWTSPELLAPARGVHPQQQAQRKAS